MIGEFFYIKDDFKNKVTYYHLLLFLVMLPFYRFYSTIIFVSFIIQSLLFLRRDRFKEVGKEIFILQSVFYISLLSATYSITKEGWNVVTKQLAIFLFPVLFAITGFDFNKYRRRLLICFSACCTLVVLYLYYDAFKIIIHNGLPVKMFFSSAFSNHNFSLPLNLHATYLSLYVLMAIMCFLEQFILSKSFQLKAFFIINIFILASGLLQLGSRAVCIAFIILLIAWPFFLLKGKKRIYWLSSTALFFILVFAIVKASGFLKERFVVQLKDDFTEHAHILKNDTRLQRWEASYKLIAASPFIGHGSGSEVPLLKDIYYDKKMYSSYLNSMNVHNQYLSFIVNSGIIGLLIYLFTLFWGFRFAIRKRDVLFFSFMMMISIVSFSENIFQINKGIFFYAFFFGFFVYSYKSSPVHKTSNNF